MRTVGKWIVAAAVLLGIAAGISGCGTANTDASSQQTKRVIKIAHHNSAPPYNYVNDKGESDGLEVAVLKEVSKKLPQYDFQFVPTSNEDLLIGVESGKYQLGTKSAWVTPPRRKKFVIPKHFISASVVGLVIRKEDAGKITDIDSFAKAGGKLVPIAPQNAQYQVILDYNKKHPDHPINLAASETFDVPDAFTWVMEGRYDGVLNIELKYKTNVTNPDGPYHKFADKLQYIRYKALPTYPLFNKKEQKLADDYDKAIEELRKEGKIAELENKYFGEEVSKLVEE